MAQYPHQQSPEDRSGQAHDHWLERRRAKIAGEIARNRRGEYTVPTWVLALILVLIIGGWITLVVVS